MLRKIFFCKIGMGMMFLLFLANVLMAQTPLSLNCGRLSLEIVAKEYDGMTSTDPVTCLDCCANQQITCERVEYHVFLKASSGPPIPENPDPSAGNFFLSYSDLLIVLNLNRIDAVVSSINKDQTESCLNDLFSDFSGDFQADVVEDEVSLRITDLTAEEPIPVIEFVDYLSIKPLFSIIVDAFPGETFAIGCTEFTYSSAQDGCTGTCGGTGTNPFTFPEPDTKNTALTLELGDINCMDEDFVYVPVIVSSSLVGTISLFDFSIVVTTTAPDGMSAKPTVLSILSGTSPTVRPPMDTPSGDGYIINVSYNAQSASAFSGTDIELFTVKIARPPNLNQDYKIGALLVPGRIRTNIFGQSGCRAIQTDNVKEECEKVAPPVCEDFQFVVTTESSPASCSELKAYATLSWDPADFGNASVLDFELLKARIDFGLQSGVTITAVDAVGFTCPMVTTCLGSCLDFVDNKVTLCVQTSSLSVANGAQIVVTFDAPVGCITSALVREMSLKLENVFPVCQPDINPAIGFPYCSPGALTISGDIATENNCWVEGVTVDIKSKPPTAGCDESFLTGDATHDACGEYMSRCLCASTIYFVKPVRNDNFNNGVTTYDLVEISKHILSIAPLGSPYKMIAADADKSGGLSSFDIVELRKLILGIYTVLPNRVVAA